MDMNNKRLTTTEFIERARKIHGKKYDYSKAKYVNAHTKVTIVCPKHNDFKQTPKNHVNDGYGCNLCGYEIGSKKQALTNDEFIKKALEIHGNKYDYSNVEYISQKHEVVIICKKHGPFKQLPSNHIHHGKGCKVCGAEVGANKNTITQINFISRCKNVHLDKYDYSKTFYQGSEEKVLIICPEHGEFEQQARLHYLGSGCPRCAIIKSSRSRRSNTKKFIKKAKEIHGSIYDYSKSKYGKNNEQKIIITCTRHGDFEQAPVKHLSGSGCPKCQKKHEGRIAEYLMRSNIIFREFSIEDKRYDFYLPDFNILIERDGQQHYRDSQIHGAKINVKQQQKNDKQKTKIAKKAGYKIARLPFWLTHKEEKIEINNILAGKPTYPDVPDLNQLKTKPKPKEIIQ